MEAVVGKKAFYDFMDNAKTSLTDYFYRTI